MSDIWGLYLDNLCLFVFVYFCVWFVCMHFGFIFIYKMLFIVDCVCICRALCVFVFVCVCLSLFCLCVLLCFCVCLLDCVCVCFVYDLIKYGLCYENIYLYLYIVFLLKD